MSRYVIKKEQKIKNGRCNFVFHVRKKGMLKNLATFRKYEDAVSKKDEFERLAQKKTDSAGKQKSVTKTSIKESVTRNDKRKQL